MDDQRTACRNRCSPERPVAPVKAVTATTVESQRLRAPDVTTALVRCLLGALFIYMGLNKTLHPVEFLKLVRQYDVLHAPFALNLVASALPWFEVFCGMLLVLGVAVRGTAVMLVRSEETTPELKS